MSTKGITACFSSDRLCPQQQCVIGRYNVLSNSYDVFECLCGIDWSLNKEGEDSPEITVHFTTEQLVDALINKGYKVTLSRP